MFYVAANELIIEVKANIKNKQICDYQSVIHFLSKRIMEIIQTKEGLNHYPLIFTIVEIKERVSDELRGIKESFD